MLVRGNGGYTPFTFKGIERKEKIDFADFQNTTRPILHQKKPPTLKQSISFIGSKIKDAIENPLTLVYMADTHKSYDMMSKIKSAVDNYKSSNQKSLVIHAGDYAMGSEGLDSQVTLLNKIGIDIATLGNHEFFSGVKNLAKELERSEFKTVISNLELPSTNPLTGLFQNGKLVTSYVKELEGKKYGFIGAVSNSINGEGYKNLTDGAKALKAHEAIKEEVTKLEDQGVNRIILISHLGYPYDKKLTQQVPGIDVIIGGHSHLAISGIKDNINLFKSTRNQEPVLLLHAGAYGEGIGVSHLIFNDNGVLQVKNQAPIIDTQLIRFFKKLFGIGKIQNLESSQNILVEVDSFSKSSNISSIIKQQKSHMTPITKLKKPLDGSWPIWGVSHIGGLTSDAVKEIAGSEVSIIQPGSIRRGIKKGIVYSETIKNHILPFNTSIVKVKITGKDILRALNKGAICAGQHIKPGILQCSGIKYTINMTRPATARVENVLIKVNDKYESLDLRKEYIVAYDKYLASGGDSLISLKNGEIIQEFPQDTYSSALTKYIKKLEQNNESLHQDFSDRITIKNKPNVDGFVSKVLHLLRIKVKSKLDKFIFKEK
ncbi:MAG: 5'-nucleotidase C-terminal domain-containing protein [Cyanobacteriota bacterium]